MDVLWLAIHLPPAALSSASDLERLACWAGGFTPRVSVASTGLLLEVGGCQRLFGGLGALRQRVAQALVELGVAARIAVAATPQGALWLAEGGRVGGNGGDGGSGVAGGSGDRGDEGDLDALLIVDLAWPADTVERLSRFGLRTLGDVRRLPSAALARRIGKEAVSLLARAYGELPDPHRDFVFPACFDQTIHLSVPVENSTALLFAARRLTAALAGWLHVRQVGVRECRLELSNRQGVTELPLRFTDVTRDAARLERVMRERLERLALVAPVEALRLVAEIVEPLTGYSGGLFDDVSARESMAALIERLRARLGEERVFGIAPVADHRPESATRRVFPGMQGDLTTSPRPFWLLPPEPLAEVRGQPYRRGPLRLLAGPERIEAGWWDQDQGVGDQRRDYFIALTQDDRWAWVFRQLQTPGGWYLHGWFG